MPKGRKDKAAIRPIVIRHPALKGADDEAVRKFGQLLVEGVERRFRVEPAQLRAGLLKGIASRITTQRLTQYAAAKNPRELRSHSDRLVHDISAYLGRTLTPVPDEPQRGRKRLFAQRDRQIFGMVQSGLSYGQVAIKLKSKRNTVQAAYRRERERRESFYKNYSKLKALLELFGIKLQEQSTKSSRSSPASRL
jgi:hypothetical protein